MAKQTFTTGQVLTAAQMTSLQQTAMGGGSTTAKTVSYVLVAADAGTVVQMNSASATTITVNTALFAAGDTVQIQNVGAGVCTVTAGTATVSTSSTLALKQYDSGDLYFNSTSAALFFNTDAADSTSPLTTKGDLYGYSTLDARIPIGTNNQVLTADSSQALGLKWATPSSGSSFSGTRLTKLSGNQSIPDSTYTAVTWPTEVFDVNGYHSTSVNTSRITIPTGYGGYYRFSWRTGVTASACNVRLYVNGTGGTSAAVLTALNGEANGSTIVLSLAAADYVECYIYQTSGSSKIAYDEANGAVGYIWFDCNYLGA